MTKSHNFSLKKYLLTTLITLISTCFISSLIILCTGINYNLNSNAILTIYNDSIKNNTEYESIKNTLEQTINYNDKNIENDINTLKEIYGKNYTPDYFVYITNFVYNTTKIFSEYIILTYIYSIAIGIILGNIIYFTFIEKSKGKKLVLETIFSIGCVTLIISFLNIVYNLMINHKIKKFYDISTNLFNNQINLVPILSIFIAIAIIAFAINYIYQSNLVKKLNEYLKK